jgi:hypothetical protein|tara:strand:- start:439 stop:684 length:246 start_codon:yes stop_codon:yes gene_type:complete
MTEKLNVLSLGYAGAIISAICMFLLGILSNFGIYTSATEQMIKWHMFFDLSVLGIFTGMIEAAALSFVFMYFFGWIYNKLA